MAQRRSQFLQQHLCFVRSRSSRRWRSRKGLLRVPFGLGLRSLMLLGSGLLISGSRASRRLGRSNTLLWVLLTHVLVLLGPIAGGAVAVVYVAVGVDVPVYLARPGRGGAQQCAGNQCGGKRMNRHALHLNPSSLSKHSAFIGHLRQITPSRRPSVRDARHGRLRSGRSRRLA